MAAVLMVLSVSCKQSGSNASNESPSTEERPAVMDSLYPFVENGKLGFIDKTGSTVIEPRFTYNNRIMYGVDELELSVFYDGLSAVCDGKKWGFIDRKGDYAIDAKYFAAGRFSEGLAAVHDDKNFGYIDKKGKYVIKSQFRNAYPFFEGLAVVSDYEHHDFGFIDKKGNYVIQPQYSFAQGFSEGLAAVRDYSTGYWGYIDKQGNYVVQPTFYEAFPFSDGLAVVVVDGWDYSKYGFIDKKGEFVFVPTFDYATGFSEGLAFVCDSEGCGFIDRDGKFVIRLKNGNARPFSEGLAAVKINGKWGYMDKSGEMVIPAIYEEACSFTNGLAMVFGEGDNTYYIDKKGKVVKSFAFVLDRMDMYLDIVEDDFADEELEAYEKFGDQEIYQIVEKMPEFPGKEEALMKYIGENIKYPQAARDAGIEGRVFVGFVIEPDGSVTNVKLIRGIGGGCDEEAMRVIKSLPKWKPGTQKGKAVRVSYQVPVLFKLK